MGGGNGMLAHVVRADPPKPAGAKSADAKSGEWYVGDALERQLDLPVGLTWEGIPLRGAVERLGQVQRVGLFLDRRFDPGQTIKLSTRDESLREMLDLLGKRIGARAVRIGPVVYLGPESSADAIATTAAVQRNRSLRALPAGTRARWVASRPWNWPQLSTPRGLIEQLAEDGQFRVAGIDRIPHDLWPAANLPPMTISQRLSLVLAEDLCLRRLKFADELMKENEGIPEADEAARLDADFALMSAALTGLQERILALFGGEAE